MSNVTVMGGVLSLAAAQPHPFQSRLRFVFTDYKPNVNGKGVPVEEASNVINTAMYMPVKVSFDGDEVGDHTNALPIGPIVSMQEEDGRIIGEAVVWRNEFAEVIDYLEESVASNKPVDFSWEIWHKSEEADDSGVLWLKECTVAGIAIVKVPAYAGRTPLLSIASADKRVQDLESKIAELEARLNCGDSPMVDSVENASVTNIEQPSPVVESTTTNSTELMRELEELREFARNVRETALQQKRLEDRGVELASVVGVDGGLIIPEEVKGIVSKADDDTFRDMIKLVQFVYSFKTGANEEVKEELTVSSAVLVPDIVDAGNGMTTIEDLARAWRSISK